MFIIVLANKVYRCKCLERIPRKFSHLSVLDINVHRKRATGYEWSSEFADDGCLHSVSSFRDICLLRDLALLGGAYLLP